MRQRGRTKQQAQRQRHGGHRIGQQLARLHETDAQLARLNGFTKQIIEREAKVVESQKHQQRAAEQQQARFDDLHPGCGDHATEGDIDDHQHADQDHGEVVLQAEQQLNQLAGTHHLHNQIEEDNRQRTKGGKGPDLGLIKTERGDIGEGKLTEVTQTLCQDEQNDRPTHEEADGVDEAIKAASIDQAGQTQQRCGRHVVAGNRQTVLETADTTAGGIEVGRRFGARSRPVGNAQREQNEHDEHGDRRNVDGLLFNRAVTGRGGKCQGRQQRKHCQADGFQFAQTHLRASAIISSFKSSKAPLARRM